MSQILEDSYNELNELLDKFQEKQDSDAKIIGILDELNEKRKALQENSDKLIAKYELLLNIKTAQPTYIYLLYHDYDCEGKELSCVFTTFEQALNHIEHSDLSFRHTTHRCYLKSMWLSEWNIETQSEESSWILYSPY